MQPEIPRVVDERDARTDGLGRADRGREAVRVHEVDVVVVADDGSWDAVDLKYAGSGTPPDPAICARQAAALAHAIGQVAGDIDVRVSMYVVDGEGVRELPF